MNLLSPEPSGKLRRRIVFHGDVQGVGFRWQAKEAANAVGAAGWVRNEWDGTVTMELQGNEEQINTVIRTLKQDRWIRIDRMDITELPLEKNERSFSVRF